MQSISKMRYIVLVIMPSMKAEILISKEKVKKVHIYIKKVHVYNV